MSGPIVRTGTTPAFWENWEKVFAGKGAAKKRPAAKAPAKSAAVKKKPSKKKRA